MKAQLVVLVFLFYFENIIVFSNKKYRNELGFFLLSRTTMGKHQFYFVFSVIFYKILHKMSYLINYAIVTALLEIPEYTLVIFNDA